VSQFVENVTYFHVESKVVGLETELVLLLCVAAAIFYQVDHTHDMTALGGEMKRSVFVIIFGTFVDAGNLAEDLADLEAASLGGQVQWRP
jgi:hypothetical protein